MISFSLGVGLEEGSSLGFLVFVFCVWTVVAFLFLGGIFRGFERVVGNQDDETAASDG